MSTQLQTIDKTYVKMRWKEDYVTAGLNKKMVGAVPGGLVRGGRMSPGGGQTVNVEPDPEYGDIVAAYTDEANAYQTTMRLVGTQNLDLSSLTGQTVYVTLFVDYTQGSETTAEWRAYTQAELNAASEKDSLVILGKVTVNSPITASDIEYAERTEQWIRRSVDQIPWIPIIRNGGFEQGLDNWEVINAHATYLRTQEADVYSASGSERALECNGATGSGTKRGFIQKMNFPVIPGQLVYVKAAGMVDGSIPGGGVCGVGIQWYDKDLSSISQSDVIRLDDSDTNWHEYNGFVEAPATAKFMQVEVAFQPGGATSTIAYLDDVQVYVQGRPETLAPQAGILDGRNRDLTTERLYFIGVDTITQASDHPNRFYFEADASSNLKLVCDDDTVASLLPVADSQFNLGGPSNPWGIGYISVVEVGTLRGSGSSTEIEVAEHLIPALTEWYDLGTGSYVWKNLYLKNLHLETGTGDGVSSNFVPATDNSVDLGVTGREWKDLWIDGQANIDELILSTGSGEGVGTDLYPDTDAARDIGSASRQWAQLWIATGSAKGCGGLEPFTDDAYDLGASGYQWKDLWIDGIATIDTLSLSVVAGEGVSSNIYPAYNATLFLGSASYRWRGLFFETAVYTEYPIDVFLNPATGTPYSAIKVRSKAGQPASVWAAVPENDWADAWSLYVANGTGDLHWFNHTAESSGGIPFSFVKDGSAYNYAQAIIDIATGSALVTYGFVLKHSFTPSEPDSNYKKGTITFDTSYMYVKTADSNGWKKITLASL